MSRSYDVIDADAHVLEPPDLWLNYIDPKYRERAPKIIIDTDGRERVALEGKIIGAPLGVVMSGSVGMPIEEIRNMKYADGRKGGFDPHARIKDMDLDGIDAAFLYPTVGLFSGAIDDPDFAAAVCRAYNRWITDYCKPYPDRLFATAMLPLQSVEHSIAEMRYARKTLGMGSGFVRPNPYNNRRVNDPTYDPLWAEAQELDFSMGFHESASSGMQAVGVDRINGFGAKHVVTHCMEMMLASLNIIWGGVCEKFPRARFAFLESGGGWMAPWLDRMDRHFDRKGVFDDAAVLKMRPSDYFRRQCWISFEPVESTITHAAEHLGTNKVLWATDYPHFDGYFPGAPKMIADKIPAHLRRQVLAQGALDFYRIS